MQIEILEEEPVLAAVTAASKLGVVGRSRKGAKVACFTCNANKGSKGCIHLKVYSKNEENTEQTAFEDIDEDGNPINVEQITSAFAEIDIDGNPTNQKKTSII